MSWGTDAWARLAELPVRVDHAELSFPSVVVSSGWERVSTVIALHGDGEVGLGEDVTYEADEHRAVEASGPPLDPTGEHTLGEFCAGIEALDLFPAGAPSARGVPQLPQVGVGVCRAGSRAASERDGPRHDPRAGATTVTFVASTRPVIRRRSARSTRCSQRYRTCASSSMPPLIGTRRSSTISRLWAARTASTSRRSTRAPSSTSTSRPSRRSRSRPRSPR